LEKETSHLLLAEKMNLNWIWQYKVGSSRTDAWAAGQLCSQLRLDLGLKKQIQTRSVQYSTRGADPAAVTKTELPMLI
jgi:hypothetical protein